MQIKTCAPLAILACLMAAEALAVESEVDRTIRWSDGVFEAVVQPLIVTASDPPTGGDRLADPNDLSTSFGLDLSGVGRLFLDVSPIPGTGAICSGSALAGGRHVLTAAHCVTDDQGDLAVLDGGDGNSVTFTTAAGEIVAPFLAGDVHVHPAYNGDLRDGFDIAVIELAAALPSEITRYALNDGAVNEASQHLAAGYGRSGDGGTGATTDAGELRSGLNNFLSVGLPVGGINNPLTQLTADFDSGFASEDAFGVLDEALFGGEVLDPFNNGLGFGPDEIGVAPGDSGGPSFLVGPEGVVIAGVHSYGLRLELLDGQTSDIDGVLNSSFGEFYVDARVAEPEVLGFIRSVTVPEPATALSAGLALVLAMNKKRRAAPRGRPAFLTLNLGADSQPSFA